MKFGEMPNVQAEKKEGEIDIEGTKPMPGIFEKHERKTVGARLDTFLDKIRPHTEKQKKAAATVIGAGLALGVVGGIGVMNVDAINDMLDDDYNDKDRADWDDGDRADYFADDADAFADKMRAQDEEYGNSVMSEEMHELSKDYHETFVRHNWEGEGSEGRPSVVKEMHTLGMESTNILSVLEARSTLANELSNEAFHDLGEEAYREKFSGAGLVNPVEDMTELTPDGEYISEFTEIDDRFTELVLAEMPEGDLTPEQKDKLSEELSAINSINWTMENARTEEMYKDTTDGITNRANATGRFYDLSSALSDRGHYERFLDGDYVEGEPSKEDAELSPKWQEMNDKLNTLLDKLPEGAHEAYYGTEHLVSDGKGGTFDLNPGTDHETLQKLVEEYEAEHGTLEV
jgi:hypothetical protein